VEDLRKARTKVRGIIGKWLSSGKLADVEVTRQGGYRVRE